MAMRPDSRTLQRGLAAFAVALAASGAAWPCGFDDPNSATVQRGMMNLAFPKSAYVRTAIWQAQLAGELPRDKLAARGDLTPQAIGTLRLIRATGLLQTLAKRLGATPDGADHPSVALVLLGPMLWSRFEPAGGGVQARVHVTGPETGDVVMVTDTPAIEAIVEGGLSFEQAIEHGLVRLYGPQAQIDHLTIWLAAL
jgi:hypothetical protein